MQPKCNISQSHFSDLPKATNIYKDTPKSVDDETNTVAESPPSLKEKDDSHESKDNKTEPDMIQGHTENTTGVDEKRNESSIEKERDKVDSKGSTIEADTIAEKKTGPRYEQYTPVARVPLIQSKSQSLPNRMKTSSLLDKYNIRPNRVSGEKAMAPSVKENKEKLMNTRPTYAVRSFSVDNKQPQSDDFEKPRVEKTQIVSVESKQPIADDTNKPRSYKRYSSFLENKLVKSDEVEKPSVEKDSNVVAIGDKKSVQNNNIEDKETDETLTDNTADQVTNSELKAQTSKETDEVMVDSVKLPSVYKKETRPWQNQSSTDDQKESSPPIITKQPYLKRLESPLSETRHNKTDESRKKDASKEAIRAYVKTLGANKINRLENKEKLINTRPTYAVRSFSADNKQPKSDSLEKQKVEKPEVVPVESKQPIIEDTYKPRSYKPHSSFTENKPLKRDEVEKPRVEKQIVVEATGDQKSVPNDNVASTPLERTGKRTSQKTKRVSFMDDDTYVPDSSIPSQRPDNTVVIEGDDTYTIRRAADPKIKVKHSLSFEQQDEQGLPNRNITQNTGNVGENIAAVKQPKGLESKGRDSDVAEDNGTSRANNNGDDVEDTSVGATYSTHFPIKQKNDQTTSNEAVETNAPPEQDKLKAMHTVDAKEIGFPEVDTNNQTGNSKGIDHTRSDSYSKAIDVGADNVVEREAKDSTEAKEDKIPAKRKGSMFDYFQSETNKPKPSNVKTAQYKYFSMAPKKVQQNPTEIFRPSLDDEETDEAPTENTADQDTHSGLKAQPSIENDDVDMADTVKPEQRPSVNKKATRSWQKPKSNDHQEESSPPVITKQPFLKRLESHLSETNKEAIRANVNTDETNSQPQDYDTISYDRHQTGKADLDVPEIPGTSKVGTAKETKLKTGYTNRPRYSVDQTTKPDEPTSEKDTTKEGDSSLKQGPPKPRRILSQDDTVTKEDNELKPNYRQPKPESKEKTLGERRKPSETASTDFDKDEYLKEKAYQRYKRLKRIQALELEESTDVDSSKPVREPKAREKTPSGKQHETNSRKDQQETPSIHNAAERSRIPRKVEVEANQETAEPVYSKPMRVGPVSNVSKVNTDATKIGDRDQNRPVQSRHFGYFPCIQTFSLCID